MKTRLFLRLAFLAICVMLSGCATPYCIDRGRDAADVFTVAGGVGAGAKLRIGPAQAAFSINKDVLGLRGGTVFFQPIPSESKYPRVAEFAVLWETGEGYTSLDGVQLSETAQLRGKNYIATGQYGLTHAFASYYYTQLEAFIGIGPSLRLGFNPGELLDFILGFTTIDIFNDDVGVLKRKNLQEEKVRKKGGVKK